MKTKNQALRRFALLASLVLLAATLFAGCRKPGPADTRPPPRVEHMSSDPVELTITADPPNVHLERDILLTVKTVAPTSIEARLPPIKDRLTGFILNGAFDREPVARKEGMVRERCFRLTPTLSDEYRLSPMAITVIDNSLQPPAETWFATRPMVFEPAPPIKGSPKSTIHDILGPVWILPPFKTVALWILGAVILAGIGVALWILSRRVQRTIRLRRMTPKERALQDLSDLIAKDLIARDRIKDFYLELTMIVRRYIERAHKIRAPEQTTKEFLAAATQDRRFSREVVLKLQRFLQSADLVKFAAFRPDPPTIDRALATARDYIETDEQATQQETADV